MEVKLPNGYIVYCRNKEELNFLYEEIFENKMYMKHGISLEDNSIVIDAGANIGMFSIFISTSFKGCKLYSFEPIPQTFEVLKKNAELYKNITAINSGLSNYIGEAEFSYFPTVSTDSVQIKYRENHEEDLRYGIANHYKKRISDEIVLKRFVDHVMSKKILNETICKCRMTTLSEMINLYNIKHIDLLKIDVEKSEFEVLEGIDEGTWNKISQVVMEVHGLSDEEISILSNIFSTRGYKVYIDLYEELNVPRYFNVYAKRN